ncbi:MAG: NUDIX hydrolase [Promethearchaeota archaeon]|nr:MAG: NUDIX hydrolase [Candidatus Lokiarchaeota archaeon]
MPEIKAIWEGNLSLSNIDWGNFTHPEYKLHSKFDSKVSSFWKKYFKEHPNDYDGTLLFLYNFEFNNSCLNLNTGTIKFSTLVFMSNFNLKVNKGIGMIGVQCLIFNSQHDLVLAGRRTKNQSYYPGALTLPGGMLELTDLNQDPKVSFMREIKEEVDLEFRNPVNLIAIISGWNGISITFLLSTQVDLPVSSYQRLHGDKDEWEDGLEWMPINDLIKMNQGEITFLDGLQYYLILIRKFEIS